MDSAIWASPSEARMMGGLASLGKLYREPNLRTLYHDLADRDYTVVTWSQRRPVGPIEEAVGELYSVMEYARGIESEGIILIGHSRGGLVSRIALPRIIESGALIRALITIASPHHGSSMARWASMLAPLAEFLDSRIPKKEHRAFTNTIKRALGFLASKGVKELLPDSEMISSLPADRPGDIYCLAAGGTNPALIEVNDYLRIPGTFQKVLPRKMIPPEMVDGKGDCLVTDESSRLTWADEHLTFYKNHIHILTDPEPRDEILKRIEGIG
jgi:pimeloyl-ACP methyl ester carboxylesterase